MSGVLRCAEFPLPTLLLLLGVTPCADGRPGGKRCAPVSSRARRSQRQLAFAG